MRAGCSAHLLVVELGEHWAGLLVGYLAGLMEQPKVGKLVCWWGMQMVASSVGYLGSLLAVCLVSRSVTPLRELCSC